MSATPIDQVNLQLDQIQGNILAGFNKSHQRFLFLGIQNAAHAKVWLKNLIPHVATTDQVGKHNNSFRLFRRLHKCEQGAPTENWLNVAFTYNGLQVLNAAGASTFPDAFRQGMKQRKDIIGDTGRSDPGTWQAPFNAPEKIHLVVLLAADIPGDLVRIANDVLNTLATGGLTLLGDIHGEDLPAPLAGHEHFGFKDGISQPGIKGFTLSTNDQPDPNKGHQGVPGQDLLWPGEFVLGYNTQVATTPPAPFDGPNPAPGNPSTAGPAWTKNGSFLVFRKLKQDVPAFLKNIKVTAAAINIAPDVLGAKLVGRYASGCPLQPTAYQTVDNGFPATFSVNDGDPAALHPEMLDPNLINNFEYGDDLTGEFVPRAGHIRKAYPRDEQTLLADGTVDPNSALHESFTQTHRLLRRGIPFGAVYPRPADPDAALVDDHVDRGLLFLCYQKSIEDQFEFVQKSWINDPDFPQPGDGEDPIMAQSVAAPIKCPFHNPPVVTSTNISHYVVTEGGEYFFQPSIAALQQLAS